MVFADRFLTDPARPPVTTADADPGREVAIGVVGGPYRVTGLTERQHADLERRYAGCPPAGSSGSTVPIRICNADRATFVDVDLAGRLNEIEFDFRPDRVALAGRRLFADLRCDRSRATVWTSEAGGAPFLEVFENCFRVLVAYRLLELGGAVVHSAGIARDDRAWILYGFSGVGKTTVARRAPSLGYRVLSDDLNALLPSGEDLRAVRMPFAGELRDRPWSPEAPRVTAVGALRQADRITWTAMTAGAAVASLAACCPFVNTDPHRVDRLLANLAAVVGSVPVGTLDMTREGDYRSVLEEIPACSTAAVS